MIEQSANKAHSLSEDQCSQINAIFHDPRVREYFLSQISSLIPPSYELIIAYQKIYIHFHLDHLNKQMQHQKPHSKHTIQYFLKIGKSFPLKSVSLHIIDADFQPRICDGRDLIKQAIGKPYEFSVQFTDIFNALPELSAKLQNLNEQYLKLQRVGQFSLGQFFYYGELIEFFPAISLFKQKQQKKHFTYIGVTETHILTFKQTKDTKQVSPKSKPLLVHHSRSAQESGQIQKKQTSDDESTLKKLVLLSYCDMQCIESMHYKEEDKELKVTFKKYKSIKLYFQEEKIIKKFKFTKPELFMRCILKFISKLQPTEILFQPYISKEGSPTRKLKEEVLESKRMIEKIYKCNSWEDEISLLVDEKQKGKVLQELDRNYQKLIQFYSARAHPYYLIFVNKLNYLYLNYYLKKQQNFPIVKIE